MVNAVRITSIINPESSTTTVSSREIHPTQFSYPANSNLDLLFKQLPPRISVNASSMDTTNQNNTVAMQSLLKAINDQFQSKNSVVRATGVNVSFIADIERFSDTETSINQRISVNLNLENFVIQKVSVRMYELMLLSIVTIVLIKSRKPRILRNIKKLYFFLYI